MNSLINLFHDLGGIIYPRFCPACGNVLLNQEDQICIKCLYYIPRVRFHDDPTNPVHKIFWGRLHLQYATSLFYYNKGSHYQTLIHHLKYKGKKEIGYELGRILGEQLKDTGFSSVDLIIPVPLHKKKLAKRGYNQSIWIGKGIAEAMNIPLLEKGIVRKIDSETQTNKTRFQRWLNVEKIFNMDKPEAFQGKHVLLVDDIVTTGATLEALAQLILSKNDCMISIATLGVAT